MDGDNSSTGATVAVLTAAKPDLGKDEPVNLCSSSLTEFRSLFLLSLLSLSRKLSSMAMPAQTLNLCGVLSESRRIINAHSRHFLALSVLFLLPLCFSLIIYPTLQSTIAQSNVVHTQIFLRDTSVRSPKSLAVPLLFALFLYFLSLCAVATITYSTYHGFYGRPVKLLSAIKSLLYSFIPLVSTTIAAQILILLVCLCFIFFVVMVVKGIEIIGFEIDYNSNYFMGICVIVSIVLAVVLIAFQVNCALASVIVVVESKWGLEPLRRSAYLLRGMRSVSLSLLLFFGVITGIMLWPSSKTVFYCSVGGWRNWAFILQTVTGSSILTMLLLHNTAANTVMYMYCKALHGELAFEIAEEFAREYVSLPFDDKKLPHVVTVV